MAVLGSTLIASEYCQVRIGGDIALMKGIMKCVLDAHDQAQTQGSAKGGHAAIGGEFIEQHTRGCLAFAQDLRRTEWVIIAYGMGVTQHRNGAQNGMPAAKSIPVLVRAPPAALTS